MKRLTTDNPQDNLSSALNLFYVKDSYAWVRGGGSGPEYKDISLVDYVRMISKKHNLDIAQSENDEDISCEMADLLFDGTDTVDGIIATLYTAGWAFAELRERLFAYEDTRLTPEEIFGLCSMEKRSGMAKMLRWEEAERDGRLVVLPPNDPLTLEELRNMRGEPAYCKEYQCWGIVKCEDIGRWAGKLFLVGTRYPEGYIVSVDFEYDIKKMNLTLYRRKPEGGEEHGSVQA